MFRSLLAVTFILSSGAFVSGQEWANKMFTLRGHDFGTVARGAKTEYMFELQNMYLEDIHIASVRTSCGCTTPSIVKPTLKTWEKGAIKAVFNTGSFVGQRGATVTVTIDRPFFAEVQLRVAGYIRSDVSFSPSFLDFGELDQGTASEKAITVTRFGNSDWKIVDVRSVNPNFEVELGQANRNASQVSYSMKVRLKESAPSGYLDEQLTLVTNEQASSTIPLVVQARLNSLVTVSPGSLALGDLDPGETVNNKLVVIGKRPCQVTDVKCPCGGFEFKPAPETKTTHIVPFTFTAGATPGPFVTTIEVATNLGKGAVQASGTVKAPVAPPAESTAGTEAK